MRLRRKNIPWLAVLGGLVGITILSGAATPLVAGVLGGLYVLALGASLIEVNPAQVISSVQRASVNRMRMSAEAQEAANRAERRGATPHTDLTLLDIGVITAAGNREGMVMRRSRSLTKDDDGARPFVTLLVQPPMADQTVVVRFEIIDPNGDQVYVHEMSAYLRDGELNILADHQLPLDGNDELDAFGEYDVRVYLDARLLGMLSFSVGPSFEERQERLQRRMDAANERIAARDSDFTPPERDRDSDAPPSLEELLKKRSSGR